MTMLRPSDVQRAVYVVDAHNAGALLKAALGMDPRGAKSAFTPRLYLIGSILNLQTNRNLVHADIYRTLTCDIDRQSQVDLGIRSTISGKALFSDAALERFSVRMSQRLEYGKGSAPELSDAERQQRHDALAEVNNALLAATLTPRQFSAFAIDGSGIWAWGRAPRRPPTDLMAKDKFAREHGVDITDVTDQDLDPAELRADLTEEQAAENGATAEALEPGSLTHGAMPTSYERDGAYGVKTRKDGGRQSYYGFELHALVRVPDRGGDPNLEANLIERLDVTPANTDVVDTSLALIEGVIASGVDFKELLADRHYSYKKPERWAKKLTALHVEQVVDLHERDQGFRDYNGAKLAAGWLHCPATPKEMGTILHPGPSATPEQKERFVAKIEERQPYALSRITREPVPRFMCPALAGKVGCPLREGTVRVAIEGGLPLIANPPNVATAPKCCTQKTVTLGEDGQRKIWQRDYWGCLDWVLSNNRRTYVEGAFGNMKNSSTENLTRGIFRITGLARVTLCLGLVAAVHNVRQQRNWQAKHGLGDPQHPLFTPDSETLLLHLTPEQYADFERYRQAKLQEGGGGLDTAA